MKKVQGDLLQLALNGKFDVIVHGCNCFGAMGAGIALLIRDLFPEAFAADLETDMGDTKKLGTISSASISRDGKNFTIVNGYTQYSYTGPGILVDYDAVKNVFINIKKQYTGLRIAYPKIGAGLAKGDWNTISDIIEAELEGEDHTLVEYKAPEK